MATASAKKFLRTMAQPFSEKDQKGVSTWDLADLERHKEKMEEEKIRELRNGVEGGKMETDEYANGNGVVNGDEYGSDEDIDAAMMDMDA